MKYEITLTTEEKQKVYRAVLVDKEKNEHTALECEDLWTLMRGVYEILNKREIETIRKWDPDAFLMDVKRDEEGKVTSSTRYYWEKGIRFNWDSSQKKYIQAA